MLRCSACRYCCGRLSAFIFLVLKRTSLSKYTHTHTIIFHHISVSFFLLFYWNDIKEIGIPSVLFNNWHTFADKGQVTILGLMDHRVFVTSTKKYFCSAKAAAPDKDANKWAQLVSQENSVHTNRQQKRFGKLIIVCQL